MSERKVVVVHWISTPLGKGKGTDEYLYELSEKKLKDMKSFLDTGIKYSIESNKKTLKKLDTPKK